MGHRDPSESEPGGHFSMAAHADEWMEAMEDRAALRELLWGPKIKILSAQKSFTKAKYPNEPYYMLFQNLQMVTMSTEERQLEALARMTHAENAKVGETIQCPGCSRELVKKSYQHKFCKEKIKGRSNCKDFINNWFNPERLRRTLVRNGTDAGVANKQVKAMERTKAKHKPNNKAELDLIKKWILDGTITKEDLKNIL